jgi:VWFA-related protein
MKTVKWFAGAMVAGCAAAALPVAGGAQVPQFRSGVDLVHLDVSVLDRQRRPVRGLTVDDFEVFEDGKLQVVSAFAAVDIPDAVEPTTPWMREVAPDTQRNDTLNDRRLFVMVIDDASAQGNVAALKSTKEIARKFIEQLGPTDLMSIVFTLNNRNAQDYTSDRAKLLKAVDKFNAGFRDLGSAEPDVPNTDGLYFRYSIETLGKVAELLMALPQQRKALVYVGQGVPVDPVEASSVPLIGQLGATASSALHGMLIQRLRVAFQKAQRANVTFYTLDTCGLRVPPPVPPPPPPPPRPPTCVPGLEVDFLRGIATETGGHSTADTNEFESGIAQIYRENSSYYLLGFASTNPKHDGHFRRLEVKVRKPGLEVRTRSGYTAPKPADEPGRGKAIDEPSPLAIAISGLLPKGEVPLQAWAAPFAAAGRTDAVVPIVLAIRQELAAREARTIETVNLRVDAYAFDGRLRSTHSLKAQVALKPGPGGETAYEVHSMVTLPPGRYQLRLAANLPSQRKSGSVYVDLEVPDFLKAPLTWSQMAFHVSPGVTTAASGSAKPGIPIVPTTQRLFRTSDQVTAFARLHQGGRRPLVSVAVIASITDSTGQDVWRRQDTIEPGRFVVDRGADVQLMVPVAQLRPGSYRLRMETGPAGSTLVRDARFTVR